MGLYRSVGLLFAVAAAATAHVQGADTCTSSEVTSTDASLTYYTDAISDCFANSCSSVCVGGLTSLTADLPDCVYTDDVNYYMAVQTALSACNEISGAADGTACSASESTDTESCLSVYSDTISAYCDTGSCSTACAKAVTDLAACLPSCVYSDGTNYYERAVEIVATCITSPTDQGATSATTASTDGDSNSDNAATTSTNACLMSEEEEIMSSVGAVSVGLDTSCTSDTCASDCMDILTTLEAQLPDCVSTDGFNYYESVTQLVASCSSASSSDAATSSPTANSSGSTSSEETPDLCDPNTSGGSTDSGKNPLDNILNKPKKVSCSASVKSASCSLLFIAATTLTLALRVL